MEMWIEIIKDILLPRIKMKRLIIIFVICLGITLICSCSPSPKFPCPQCGRDLKINSPQEYNFDTISRLIESPTCVKEGTYIQRCFYCGCHIYEKKIPPINIHRYMVNSVYVVSWGDSESRCTAMCYDCGDERKNQVHPKYVETINGSLTKREVDIDGIPYFCTSYQLPGGWYSYSNLSLAREEIYKYLEDNGIDTTNHIMIYDADPIMDFYPNRKFK